MSLKKLSKEVIIYGVNNGLKSLVPVLIVPILTRYLTPSEYGILSLIEVSILFLLPFITFNASGAIKVEYYNLNHRQLKNYISDAIAISLLSFLIFLCLFIGFSDFIATSLNLPPLIIMVLPCFVISRFVSRIVGVLLQVQQKPLHFASYTLIQTITDFSLSLIFVAILKWGYWGRLGGIYSAFLIVAIIGVIVLFKMDMLNTRPKLKYSKSILKFGVPLIPHTIGGTILAMSDRYFITYFVGESEVGYYTVGYQLSAVMLLVGTSLNLAWTPFLFNLLKEKTSEAKRKIKSALVLVLFFLLICGGIVYLGKGLLFFIFSDPKFYSAKEFFPFLLLGFVFQSLYTVISVFLFYFKRTSLLARITIGGALVNLLLNYILINEFSTIGVAYATAITWVLYCSVVSYFVYNECLHQKSKLTHKNS